MTFYLQMFILHIQEHAENRTEQIALLYRKNIFLYKK